MVPVVHAQTSEDNATNSDSVTEPDSMPMDEELNSGGTDIEPNQRWRDCNRWGRDRWGRRCRDERGNDCNRWGRDRWGRRCDDFGRDGRGSFSVRRYPISGREVVDCQDWRIGGRRSAELVSCIDIGDGRNHGCYAVSRTACLAWEGGGNGGSAGCIAYCRGGGY